MLRVQLVLRDRDIWQADHTPRTAPHNQSAASEDDEESQDETSSEDQDRDGQQEGPRLALQPAVLAAPQLAPAQHPLN